MTADFLGFQFDTIRGRLLPGRNAGMTRNTDGSVKKRDRSQAIPAESRFFTTSSCADAVAGLALIGQYRALIGSVSSYDWCAKVFVASCVPRVQARKVGANVGGVQAQCEIETQWILIADPAQAAPTVTL